MSAVKAGYLRQAMFKAEASYGTIPTSKLDWAGETQELILQHNDGAMFHPGPGGRSFRYNTDGPFNKAFTLKSHCRSGEYWKNFHALYGLGSTSGVANTLGSFFMQDDIYDGSTHMYQFFNGCKINSLMIEGIAPGQPLVFSDEIYCQYHETDSNKDITTIQTVTVGADADAVTSAILDWAGNSQINLGGGGLGNWYLKNFKLTANNHLLRQPGIRTGGDSNAYPVDMEIFTDMLDIILEGTIILEDMTYIDAMTDNTAVTAVTIPIDDDTITLSDGYFTKDNYPTYSQSIIEMPIKIMFQDISIA